MRWIFGKPFQENYINFRTLIQRLKQLVDVIPNAVHRTFPNIDPDGRKLVDIAMEKFFSGLSMVEEKNVLRDLLKQYERKLKLDATEEELISSQQCLQFPILIVQQFQTTGGTTKKRYARTCRYEIEKAMRDPSNVVYGCKEAGSLRGVDRKNKMLRLGAVNEELGRNFGNKPCNVSAIDRHATAQIFEMVEDKTYPSYASEMVLDHRGSHVGALHCQAGQEKQAYVLNTLSEDNETWWSWLLDKKIF